MVGLSYGSQIGAQYAQLFPNNIRTLVLDGILQHSQSAMSNSVIESLGYSLGLSHFFQWSSEEDSSPLKGQNVEAIWNSLLANASTKPLLAPSCDGITCLTDVTAEELLFNAQEGLAFKFSQQIPGALTTWGSLASALYNATTGDASALSMPLQPTDAGTPIYCLDVDHEPRVYDLTYMRSKQEWFTTLAPLNQGASASTQLLHSCVGWPIPPRNPPRKLDVDTKTTILMVSSTADPATAYPWAVGMLEEIRNKAFITRTGDGHTSFLTGGHTKDTIVEYLLSGTAPKTSLTLES
jgi:pimeloyl-ACP methyl ester carboxylesterase